MSAVARWPESPPVAPPSHEQATGRILIVEDEAIVAIDIQSQLEALGYEVVAIASSAAEASALAHRLSPDLVLMDIHLQGDVDGISAAEQIRRDRQIPIVFLTAYVDPATLRRAQRVGPYGYIVKPFSQRDLHTTIQMALYKGQLDRQLQRSHDDLRAVLDAQRHGTVMLDEDGQVSFVSRAALALLNLECPAAPADWRELLRLPDEAEHRLAAMLTAPFEHRAKIVAQLITRRASPTTIEIEVKDDPRGGRRRILFLYDISQLHDLRRMLDGKWQFEKIIGKSDAIVRVWKLIEEYGRVESTVLIEGETGVGKELVARAIHNRSARRDKPFVALNCAGLSEDLAASQLFGHRRGAFTGAVEDQVGLFEAAQGGTLFLDEIGELPIRIQTTLLRVLEERQVMRLGESRLRPVDARIITATNRNLAEETTAGRFRSDLLYRVRVARITLPPLRERREDIPLLIRAFLETLTTVTGKTVERLDEESLRLLMSYDWPGNIRELRNALEYAVIRARDPALGPDDLPPEILGARSTADVLHSMLGTEHDKLLAALERAGGNRSEAAQLLGISRATLYRRLAQYDIDHRDERTS